MLSTETRAADAGSFGNDKQATSNDAKGGTTPDSNPSPSAPSKPAPLRTPLRRVSKWIWAIITWPIVGPGMALVGFHRYMSSPRVDAHSDVIKAPAWALGWGVTLILGVGVLKAVLPKEVANPTIAFGLEILPLLFAEIGVAMIVAYIIARAIDTQARQIELEKKAAEQQEMLEREAVARAEDLDRERRMTQDVFTGVLGIAHEPGYVARVIETTLNRKVIRRSVTLMYTLARVSVPEAEQFGIEHPDRFMFLDQAVSFEFENLSADTVPLPVKFVVPARHGVKLRAASRILSAMFDGVPTEPEDVVDDPNSDSKIYTWDRSLERFKKLSIALKARVVKEDSDSDVWCSYFPCTEGMTLLVNAPAGLTIGVRNNTSSKLVEEIPCGDDGMAMWKFDGPILPNNSVVFYWKTREHDDGGSQAAEAPRERAPARSSGEGMAHSDAERK